MTIDLFLQYITWGIFVLIFLSTMIDAVRFTTRATVNVALFFASAALIILISAASSLGILPAGALTDAAGGALLLALPLLLVRLAGDFSHVPAQVARLAAALFACLAVGVFMLVPPRPVWYNLAGIAYFVGLQFYSTVAFVRESRVSSGVTRRRLRAVAAGSVLLGLAILVSSLPTWTGSEGMWMHLFEVLSLSSGISYYLGFSPPLWLRRTWQQPEVNSLYRDTRRMIHLLDLTSVRRELEQAVAESLGATKAHIGIWDEGSRVLKFEGPGGDDYLVEPEMPSTAAHAFLSQRPVLSTEAPADDSPANHWRREQGVRIVMAAPITGAGKIGTLVAYALRQSIFARDDLDLLQLLADQAAVVLEAHILIHEMASVRAAEETVRLRDEFLSAAAHDLKNPLASIAGFSQLLMKRAERSPESPVDLKVLGRVHAQAMRMTRMIDRILDSSRAEEGRLVGTRSEVDLARLAAEAADTVDSDLHKITVEAETPVVGKFDGNRVMQLLENLLANAVKYSPDGGTVRVAVTKEGNEAQLAVTDQGIGVPAEELPHIFERFHRASNSEVNRVEGTGLGLFICRRIVEEHGGRIWATSQLGKGTTIHVILPLLVEDAGAGEASNDHEAV